MVWSMSFRIDQNQYNNFPLSTLLLFMALCIPSLSSAADTKFLQGLRNTNYTKIESKGLERPFHIYVSLPDNYDAESDKTYPTIYLLDGGALFPLIAAYSRYLHFGEEIPDVIIVGISYGSLTFSGGNYRSTDYTAKASNVSYWGGAAKFSQFLSSELFPMIERDYQSDASRRVVFGQSLGGQFALYAAQNEPTLFWGHIASNPALHQNLPFYLKPINSSPNQSTKPKLFVSSGSLDDPLFREPAVAWIKHWTAQKMMPWQLKTMTLEGHSHMSTPPVAFREGMAWLFSDAETEATTAVSADQLSELGS